MEKKGFTLVELIGVIVILSILLVLGTVAFVGIRKTVLENQYNNLILYLSSKAANYAEETGELNVTVERLIEVGSVEVDDDNIIRDPRNNASLNCLIFDSKYENGNYNAVPNKDIGLNENGRCNKYEVKKEMQICVMDGDVCNTQIASWYNKNVVLSVLIGGNQDLVNNAEVNWKVDGVVTNGATYQTNISRINKGIYTADIKYEELRPDGTTKLIEGVEIVAINIDLVKPEVTKININKEEQWTNENKKVTINVTDNNGSGVAAIAIVSGNTSCSNVTNDWNILISDNYVTELDNGVYNVCVQDIAGNISNNNIFEIKKIDKIEPTCSINVATPDGDNEWYTSKPVTISLVSSDNIDGNIAHGLHRDNDTVYYNGVTNINHTEDVEKTIYYGFVKDIAGNEAICSKEISLDTINPKCTITVTGDKTISGSEWYTSDVTITLVETKGTSNIVGHNLTTSATVSYKNDTNLLAITQNNTNGINYYGYVKGESGREGSCEKVNIRVDTTKPSIGTITFEDTATSGQKVIKTRISDSGAKLMAYAITTNGNPPSNWIAINGSPETYDVSYTTTSNGTHYIWAKDNAGNVRSEIADVKISYDQVTKVRYENADGTWGSYVTVETKRVEEGKTYSWSTSSMTNFDSTIYQAANVASYTVTGEKTNQVSIYRKTFTCKINYQLQNADGTYASAQVGTNSTLRYGETCKWSRAANTTYLSASYSVTIIANVNQTISVDRKTFTVTKRYRLQNVDGTYPSSYTSDGTVTVRYGDSYTYSRAATTTHQAASTSSSNVTANATLSLDVPRKTFTVTKQYRLQNADETYPSSYTSDGTQTVRYGDSYTYSIAATTTHQAASETLSNVTSNQTISVNVPRKTFTITKRYRLQNADGTYPSSYTSDGTATAVYGGSYTYSKTATTSHQASSTSTSNVTANATLSLDIPRKTFTCTKRYRLQNADGTWGSYTTDGSVTAVYGGSCSYSKTVTDYKGSSGESNGSAGSASASNVTANQTLSISMYRNTYTLTVTASTNTSSATGGGTKRWGQSCTVGVTKAANTTCVTYATPTWTASTGTAPAAGASSTYTMPKSNATVTATSAASNVSQTITLSKGTGVSGIKIGSTNYTGSSVLLTCGDYSISGNYSAGYSFSSWSRANGVTVASTSNASTTMTVSGAGTLILNSKANTYNLVITGDEGVSAFSVRAGGTSGTTISCTKSGNKFTCSNLANGTNYYLYPTFNSGFSFGSYTKTGSATNAQLGATDAQNTYYKMGAGAGAITISSKLGLCDDLDHCMQTATMENCGNTMKDARDGKSYTTAIIGTECWMTKNLSLAGGTALTSVLSNVASSYVIPASDCSASYGSDPVGTFMCNDSWGKGAYYSWNIAVAGSATVPTYDSENPAPSDLSYENVAPYDICPKRWKLPTSFGQIANAVCERDGGTRYCYPTGSPFYGELNGHPLYSGQNRIGDFGFIWSSTYSPRVYGCEVVNGQVGCGYSGGINSLYIRSNMFTYQSVTSGHAKGIRCILK